MISVYVDFHNSTPKFEARLNTIGSIRDLDQQGVILKDGLVVRLYCDELEVMGVVRFSEEEQIWVAEFNPKDLGQTS